MKTCFNTITAGRDTDLFEILTACGEAGFQGVEIDLDHLDACLQQHSLEEVKSMLRSSRLGVASLMAFQLEVFGDAAPHLENLRRASRLAVDLDCPTLLTYCVAEIPRNMSHDEALGRAAERAGAYADAAAPVSIALEPIGRAELMGGPDAAREIAARSGRPNVGIMMDTFHYYLSQVQPDRIRAVPAESMLIVHINDCEDLPIESLGDHHRLMPGLGILPLAEDLAALRDIGYTGFLSLEIFRPEYWALPVPETVRLGISTLTEVMARSGVLDSAPLAAS